MERDHLTSEEAKQKILSIYSINNYVDTLTGIELIRRGKYTEEQLKNYVISHTKILEVKTEEGIGYLNGLETSVKQGKQLNKKDLIFLPEGFIAISEEIGFNISDYFIQKVKQDNLLPLAYDLEKAIFEASIIKHYRPEAKNTTTFSIFFDGFNPGHEGWHYGETNAVDEHIIKKDGKIVDAALDLRAVLLTTWSKELFPNEETVAESLKKNQLRDYPNAPIIEAKSQRGAFFVAYHLIAERTRTIKKATIENYPLNFL